MKNKLLLLFYILLVINPMALAIKDLPQPKWSEFCPDEYAWSDYKDTSYSELGNGLLAATLIGLPIAMDNYKRHQRALDNNYWVKRREQFNATLNMCNASTTKDQTIACYMSLRQQEYSRNGNYAQAQLMAAEMQSNTLHNINNNMQMNNQMNELNSNINSINRSIQMNNNRRY